jgi:general secretion pathway protein B
MSFILDALKKSESDRQRQSGPALFEVKVAPRRVGLPPWAIALGVLLAVNLGIVMWMLLRPPSAPAAEAAAVPAPTPAPAAVPAAQPQAVPVPTPPVVTTAAPAAAAITVPTPVANAAQAQGLPASPAAGEGNPDDTVPAAEPAPAPNSHVKRGTAEGVPLYSDAAVVPGTNIPQLRLDLHVYAQRPEERFVMINMKKLREGDTLPEGVRVEQITPEGVILSHSGSRFLLPNN